MCVCVRVCVKVAANVYDCCNASVLQTLFSSSRLLVTHSHHSVFVIHCTAFVITRRNNQVFMFVITPDLSKVFCYIFYLWYLFVASGYIILLVSCFVSFFCFVFCPLLQSAFLPCDSFELKWKIYAVKGISLSFMASFNPVIEMFDKIPVLVSCAVKDIC